MFLHWNGRLGVFCSAVFLVLTHYGGHSEVVSSSRPIIAMVGDDTILDCHLEPSADISTLTVEWARLDLSPRFVYVRRNGVELQVNQNPSYVGRTSLSTENLKHGDMSLTLSRVKPSDKGMYRCHVPAQGTAVVELVVGSVSSSVRITADVDEATRELLLQCQSEGWYPEPEVLWLDGEGHNVSAVRTETVRGPDGLYTVSSRLTVENRLSNNFTCRVQQKIINQTRETTVQITGVVFSQPSYAVLRISLVLFAVLLFLTAPLVLLKFRQSKSKNKKHHDSESPGEEEEQEEEKPQLITERKEMRDVEEEKFQDKEEEKKVLIQVISLLENQKRDVETTIEKDQTELDQLEDEWGENEKKLQKKKNVFSVKQGEEINSLLNAQIKLERERTEYQTLLKLLREKLQKTNETLTATTERKEKVEKQVEEMKKLFKEKEKQRVESHRKDQSQNQRNNQSQTDGKYQSQMQRKDQPLNQGKDQAETQSEDQSHSEERSATKLWKRLVSLRGKISHTQVKDQSQTESRDQSETQRDEEKSTNTDSVLVAGAHSPE